jgi:hypothetical protein
MTGVSRSRSRTAAHESSLFSKTLKTPTRLHGVITDNTKIWTVIDLRQHKNSYKLFCIVLYCIVLYCTFYIDQFSHLPFYINQFSHRPFYIDQFSHRPFYINQFSHRPFYINQFSHRPFYINQFSHRPFFASLFLKTNSTNNSEALH